MSDPNAVRHLTPPSTHSTREGHGIPVREPDIETADNWKTQLTKGCRLLTVVKELEGSGYYIATVELCFGIIERSLEAFAMVEGGDTLRDFQTDSRPMLQPRGRVRPLHARPDTRTQRPL